MLKIRDAITQQLRGQHSAVSCAVGVYAVLLQPPQVEHSIVRDVGTRRGEKVPKRLPAVLVKFPAVDNNDGTIAGTDLQQTQPANYRLQSSRLRVKRHRHRRRNLPQVLNTKQHRRHRRLNNSPRHGLKAKKRRHRHPLGRPLP